MVHAVGKKSAMVPSLRKRAEGEIKERREGSLDEGGMQAAVSPKEERRKGVQYGDEGKDQEPTGCQVKEKRIVHEDGECGMMLWPCGARVLMGLTQTASTGHATK